MEPEKTRPLDVGPGTDAVCYGEDDVIVSRACYCRDLCVTGPVLVAGVKSRVASSYQVQASLPDRLLRLKDCLCK